MSFEEDCTCEWGFVANVNSDGCISVAAFEASLASSLASEAPIALDVSVAATLPSYQPRPCRTVVSQTRATEEVIMGATGASRVAVVSGQCEDGDVITTTYRAFCDGECGTGKAEDGVDVGEGVGYSTLVAASQGGTWTDVSRGLVKKGVHLNADVSVKPHVVGGSGDGHEESQKDPKISTGVAIFVGAVGAAGLLLMGAFLLRKRRMAARSGLLGYGDASPMREPKEAGCFVFFDNV